MSATGFYPVLMSSDVGAAAEFYRDLFGFQTTFETIGTSACGSTPLSSQSLPTITRRCRGTTARFRKA